MVNSKRPSDYIGVSTQELLKFLNDVLAEDQFNNIFIPNSKAYNEIKTLFTIALNNMDLLFPNMGVKQNSNDPKDYIRKWVIKFSNALQTPPSKRIAKLPGSAADPALGAMVKEKLNVSDKDIEDKTDAHKLFMSAENIQGNLLEEYIANIAEPQGWIWARGETLRACDFVKNSTIISYIQIKNRDNTENSSSSAIRNGTQIQKWFRLKTLHKNGKPYASFMWDDLNKIMDLKKPQASEKNYEEFLTNVVRNNTKIITI